MDFNAICRPKPPPKKKAAAPPPKQPEPAPAPPPPPPPPPPPQNPYAPFAAHFDQLSRMEHLKSVEISNSRTMKLNYGEFPNQQFGVYEYSHLPVGGLGRGYGGGGGAYNYNNDHHHHYPPQMALHPPQENRYALPGPPQHHMQMDHYRGAPPPMHGMPPPGYQHGPPPPMLCMPPPGYQHGPPPPNMEQYCHMFNDENPNACMIM